jgi:hypothetical protein
MSERIFRGDILKTQLQESVGPLLATFREKSELADRPESEVRAAFLSYLGKETDRAKSEARDYVAANVFKALAVATVITSKDVQAVAEVGYEDHGYEYYDVVGIQSTVENSPRINIPRPQLRDNIILSLASKDLRFEDEREHRRSMESEEGIILDAKTKTYEEIAKLAEQGDLAKVINSVYDEEVWYDEEPTIPPTLFLIEECQKAAQEDSGFKALADKREGAYRDLGSSR